MKSWWKDDLVPNEDLSLDRFCKRTLLPADDSSFEECDIARFVSTRGCKNVISCSIELSNFTISMIITIRLPNLGHSEQVFETWTPGKKSWGSGKNICYVSS